MVERAARFAELTFARLCAAAGAVCNESIEDETGWDYLVEFPLEARPGLPADLHPVPPTALVQVKSTRGQVTRCAVKLSNALRFAKSPTPCFLVLMVMGEGSEPLSIYGVHVWEELIARTLKRAREADRDGRSDLNRLSLTIAFGPDDERGADLVRWMRSTIASIGGDYAAAKRHLVERVGFEEAYAGGQITVGPLESIGQLVDHQLGLCDDLPVSHVTLRSRRFGIDAAEPIFEGTPTSVRMQANPVGACIIRLRSAGGGELTLNGEVIAPGIPGLPPEYMKVRLRTPILDILWSQEGVSSFNANLAAEDRRPLAQIEAFASIIGWGADGPIDAQVWVDGQRLFGAEMAPTPAGDEGLWSDLSRLAGTLRRVADPASPLDLAISIRDLEVAGRPLVDFHGLLTGASVELNYVAGDDRTAEAPCDAMLAYGHAVVGGWTFMAVIERPVVLDERTGRARRLRFGPARWLDHHALPGGLKENLASVQADYERHLARRQRTAATLGLGDAVAMAALGVPPPEV